MIQGEPGQLKDISLRLVISKSEGNSLRNNKVIAQISRQMKYVKVPIFDTPPGKKVAVAICEMSLTVTFLSTVICLVPPPFFVRTCLNTSTGVKLSHPNSTLRDLFFGHFCSLIV